MSAEAEIKQFIDRILRLKEEQDTLGEDIREVYAEAKCRGYDKTVLGNVVSHLRKVEKLGRDTLSEREAIFEMYLSAYENGGRAHAPARTREIIEEFPAQAKLVETVAAGLQTEIGRKALIAAVDIMIERDEQIDPETGEITNSPEMAIECAAPEKDAAADERNVEATVEHRSSAPISETTPDPQPPVVADGQPVPSSSPNSVKSDRPVPVVGQDREGGTIAGQEGQAVNNFEPPAFLQPKAAKTARDYRPHCRKPDACGASGLAHCYSCSISMTASSEVA
ncbi:DUF2312 domain-containing protein [Phyllobacterium sp. 0TCS1.6C]|uniref:DUF2312 domain-containing protein n=1 Tax=unclassified Phyllobacterium TaxID=2638441 RepID=UPI0022654DCE|nr:MULTISPECIES: DUF2312 domain-containing protein [unclassified Phyllobacterium]MCX8282453.1 DUF2312 domain-containing protein [Phyllobacterium sp. 0TCS1.6C]MCX8292545.1 DUF2312 domain-containing protein [Phyllobacterium sp. 0TCS1.6A]